MSDVVVKQRASVYTVMLVVSFLCLVVACLFLYFEMNYYEFMTKVPDAIRAKNAETEAGKTSTPEPVVEPEPMDPMPMDPMPMEPMPMEPMPMAPMPMPDPGAPMPDPAAPMADPAAM